MAEELQRNSSPARTVRTPFGALALLAATSLLLALPGCSTISDSISDSVSSPFKSSSESSSGSSEERKASYQDDLRKYAEVCARSNCAGAELARGVAAIAEKYGVTNWEAEDSTYGAIGEGLAKATTPQPQVDLYKSALAPNDAAHAEAIQKAFDKARK